MTTQPEAPSFPCSWPVEAGCLPDDWESAYNAYVRAQAVALASTTLERLVGYRVSNCPVKVRPCTPAGYWTQPHHLGTYGDLAPWHPAMDQYGVWVNRACGSDCDPPCSITLPAPVGRVDEVRANGLVVTDYQLLDERTLVYTGSDPCPFPASQDLSKPDTEDGTFSVTYLNAYPVDAAARCAVSVLALEYARALRGDGKKCRLPTGVTSIVRQGVSIEVDTGAFPGGVTGIREVDAFITAWNPQALQRGPSVWSPDMPRARSVR